MKKRRRSAKPPKKQSPRKPTSSRKSALKAKRPAGAPVADKPLDDLGKIRDEFRTLKADFDAADAEGVAAIKDHDFNALDRGATKEADIVTRQKRLSARLIELQKRSVPKR